MSVYLLIFRSMFRNKLIQKNVLLFCIVKMGVLYQVLEENLHCVKTIDTRKEQL